MFLTIQTASDPLNSPEIAYDVIRPSRKAFVLFSYTLVLKGFAYSDILLLSGDGDFEEV
ncbi:MAG: hypothetical protein AAFS00_17910 [Bacteroidota bacterium]